MLKRIVRARTRTLRSAPLMDELLLRDEAVNAALDFLVERNCDREYLISCLRTLIESRTADSWEYVTGFAPRQLTAVLKRMRKCAAELEHIHAHWAKQKLQHVGPGLRAYSDLPDHLRAYAAILETWRKGVGPERHPSRKIAIAQLVAYVHEKTKRYWDKHVSALIGAALGNSDYNEVAQRMWRKKYHALYGHLYRPVRLEDLRIRTPAPPPWMSS